MYIRVYIYMYAYGREKENESCYCTDRDDGMNRSEKHASQGERQRHPQTGKEESGTRKEESSKITIRAMETRTGSRVNDSTSKFVRSDKNVSIRVGRTILDAVMPRKFHLITRMEQGLI